MFSNAHPGKGSCGEDNCWFAKRVLDTLSFQRATPTSSSLTTAGLVPTIMTKNAEIIFDAKVSGEDGRDPGQLTISHLSEEHLPPGL